MKKVLLFILIPVIITIFLFRTQIKTSAKDFIYYSPCDTPIPYSIGTIDSGFDVARDELLADVKEAATIWDTTQGKELFVYDPSSKFTINMVYDSRQALTSQITQLNSDLKQKQGAIDPQITSFKQEQAAFEKKVNDLNNQIQYWNSRGGAPKDEYDKLVAQQKSLQEEANNLNATAKQLGQSTQEYNLNAEKLNNTINNYQEVLQNKPEEGLYEQQGNERKISIYIDISKEEFQHTLAHEMGHALGIDHNSNPKSIMYPQTTNALIPTNEDVSNLNLICMKRTIFEVFLNRISEAISIIRTRISTAKQ